MWDTQVHNITTNANVVNGRFNSEEELDIVKVDGSCGCAVSKYDDKGFSYSITLRSVKDNIPNQLYNKGVRHYDKEVNMHVYHKDGKTDRFVVKIRVNEN